MIRTLVTPGNTELHISIPENYVGKQIEVLLYAIYELNEENSIEFTQQQKDALDKELAAIVSNPAYLQKWNDVKHRFRKH